MLSQAEIDALLAGNIEVEQSGGEGAVNLAELMGKEGQPHSSKREGKKVRPYNFWSPNVFSKEQTRALELIHEDLAERLTSSLPSFLRSEFHVRMVHVEQGRFEEFLKDLPEKCLFHLLRFDPLPGRVVLLFDHEVTWRILGGLLGGKADGESAGEQALTEMSQSVLEVFVRNMLTDFKAAWSRLVELQPRLEESTTNQHWVQMAMVNARVKLVTFELVIDGTSGTMNLYIPFSTLKPVTQQLDPHLWAAGEKKETVPDDGTRQKLMAGLMQVALDLRVVLGEADLTVAELTRLEPGDIIPLESEAHGELAVCVGDRTRFLGRAGKVGRRLAVQIQARVDEKAAAEPLPVRLVA